MHAMGAAKTNKQTKCFKRQRGKLYTDQGIIQKEDTAIKNTYEPNIGAPQYIRQMLTAVKGEIDSNTIIVGGFNTPLRHWTNHPDRKSVRKHRP